MSHSLGQWCLGEGTHCVLAEDLDAEDLDAEDLDAEDLDAEDLDVEDLNTEDLVTRRDCLLCVNILIT